jgi:hypothetical protein
LRGHTPEIEVVVSALNPTNGFANPEILEILGIEGGESLREVSRIVVSESEAHSGRWIREHRALECLVAELTEFLVRKYEPDVIFARAGEKR